jgi:hypothetical protein
LGLVFPATQPPAQPGQRRGEVSTGFQNRNPRCAPLREWSACIHLSHAAQHQRPTHGFLISKIQCEHISAGEMDDSAPAGPLPESLFLCDVSQLSKTNDGARSSSSTTEPDSERCDTTLKHCTYEMSSVVGGRGRPFIDCRSEGTQMGRRLSELGAAARNRGP